MVGALIALIVVLGGGASIAAQSSLPGSVLYPVKVNINEEVAASFKFSDQAKADFEAQRAQERVKEAEELSLKTSVDAQTKAQIEANFKDFADRTRDRIATLASTDAQASADVASNFETALRAHEKVLARLAIKDKESSDEVKGLQADVDGELSAVVKARVAAEAKIRAAGNGPMVQAAAQGKITAATNVISEVTAYIELQKSKLSADAVLKAQAQLTVAQKYVTQANAKVKAGAYSDAFMLGNAAIRAAQEAKLLIRAQDELNVDLHLDGKTSESMTSSGSSVKTDGYMESQMHAGGDGASAGGRVNIQLGF